jgi:hypothetical protein
MGTFQGNPRIALSPCPSAGIPNLPWIVGGALKSPGGVDELGEIGARAPVEVELGARIVEPVGMIGAGYVDRFQALRRLEISGDGGIVDGLVHRDVVKLALRRRIVERGQDGVDEVVDVDEVALERAPVRVAQEGNGPRFPAAFGDIWGRASSSPGRRRRHRQTKASNGSRPSP